MKKGIATALIVSVLLVIAGAVVFGAAYGAAGRRFSGLSTDEYIKTEHEIDERFENISVDIETSDIEFLPAQDGKARVVCKERPKQRYSVEVRDGTLSIALVDSENWTDKITVFGSSSMKISVYLPETDYKALKVHTSTGDTTLPAEIVFDGIEISGTTGNVSGGASASGRLSIHMTTGDITLKDLRAEAMDIGVTTGDIRISGAECAEDIDIRSVAGNVILTDIACKDLTASGTTGELKLKNVTASGIFDLSRTTGDIRFDSSDAEEIYARTNTGDVTGTLKTEKIFLAETNTGSCKVPKSVSGGRCEVSATTGDIRLDVE